MLLECDKTTLKKLAGMATTPRRSVWILTLNSEP